MSQSAKIVVTGARGQLGSELCRQFGNLAVGLDLPQFDLTDRDIVLAALDEIRPQAIINTAAYTQVDQAQDEPDRVEAINTQGVATLVEACQQLKSRLVQISTDYVFDGRGQGSPYRETDPPTPQGVYARTKLEGELEAARLTSHFVIRTCGLYGKPGPRTPGHFVDTMLRLGRTGKPLRVVDDQHCTPTYIPHLAKSIRFLLSTEAFGTYHVVNQGETTWHGMAAEIFRLAGLDVNLEPISTSEYGARAPRPCYSVLDTSKYHALLGCPVMPLWRDALAEYVNDKLRK